MKTIFRTLCVLCGASLALTSCLGDDEEKVTLYSDTAITQMTLGTLNRYTQTTSGTTGNDTIIKSTVTGSLYPMTIDQLNDSIYNRTPLPVGTDVRHVVISSMSAKNSGLLAIKSPTSDSLQWLTTKDSIDFSVPRIIRVYSTDGTAARDYTVRLNVSQTEGTTFGWTLVRNDVDVTGFTQKHLVAFADSVVLADKGVVAGHGRAYRLDAQGLVETSTDMETWTAAGGQQTLSQLVAVGTTQLFARGTDGGMKRCDDLQAADWQDEQLDDAPSLLPQTNVAAVVWPYAPADHTDYVLMVGDSPVDDTKTVVWRKISQYDGLTKGGQWVYMPVDDDNRYALPRQEHLSLACYDDVVLAVGAAKVMLQSADQGITWKTAADYALPETLTGGLLTMTTDVQGRLWLLTESGELWQGGKK